MSREAGVDGYRLCFQLRLKTRNSGLLSVLEAGDSIPTRGNWTARSATIGTKRLDEAAECGTLLQRKADRLVWSVSSSTAVDQPISGFENAAPIFPQFGVLAEAASPQQSWLLNSLPWDRALKTVLPCLLTSDYLSIVPAVGEKHLSSSNRDRLWSLDPMTHSFHQSLVCGRSPNVARSSPKLIVLSQDSRCALPRALTRPR